MSSRIAASSSTSDAAVGGRDVAAVGLKVPARVVDAVAVGVGVERRDAQLLRKPQHSVLARDPPTRLRAQRPFRARSDGRSSVLRRGCAPRARSPTVRPPARRLRRSGPPARRRRRRRRRASAWARACDESDLSRTPLPRPRAPPRQPLPHRPRAARDASLPRLPRGQGSVGACAGAPDRGSSRSRWRSVLPCPRKPLRIRWSARRTRPVRGPDADPDPARVRRRPTLRVRADDHGRGGAADPRPGCLGGAQRRLADDPDTAGDAPLPAWIGGVHSGNLELRSARNRPPPTRPPPTAPATSAAGGARSTC